MNSVLRHIEFLLSTHDCVVVPGFGAFLASWHSALFDDEAGRFVAPCRRFTFNESLNASDGLLIMSIARAESIDYNAAKRKLAEAVSSIRSELNTNGEFTFGRIGRLEKYLTGSMRFIPAKSDLLTPLANWLGDVSIEPIESVGITGIKRTETGKITLEKRKWSVPQFVRTAAGAAAAILLALVVSTPVAEKTTFTASTVPVISAPQRVTMPVDESQTVIAEPVEVVEDVFGFNEEKPLDVVDTAPERPIAVTKAIPEEDTKPSQEKKESPVSKDKAEKKNIEPKYKSVSSYYNMDSCGIRFDYADAYIAVVASFNSPEDASRFISENKYRTNLKLGFVEKDRKYRVYAATGQTRHEAKQQSAMISKVFPGAWPAER